MRNILKGVLTSIFFLIFIVTSVIGSYLMSFKHKVIVNSTIIKEYNNVLEGNSYTASKIDSIYEYVISKERSLGLGENTLSKILNKEYIKDLYRKRLLILKSSLFDGNKDNKLYTDVQKEVLRDQLIKSISNYNNLSDEQKSDINNEIINIMNYIEYNVLYYNETLTKNGDNIKDVYDRISTIYIIVLAAVNILFIVLIATDIMSLYNIIILICMNFITIISVNIYIKYLINYNILNVIQNDVLEMFNNIVLSITKTAICNNIYYNIIIGSILTITAVFRRNKAIKETL